MKPDLQGPLLKVGQSDETSLGGGRRGAAQALRTTGRGAWGLGKPGQQDSWENSTALS